MKKKKHKNSFFILFRNVFLILLSTFLLYFSYQYYSNGVIWDQSFLSGQFNSAVASVLLDANVLDDHILEYNNTEKKILDPLPILFISTRQRIVLQSRTVLDDILKNLEKLNLRYSMQWVTKKIGNNQTEVCIGRRKRVFQTIVFTYPSS